MVFVSFPNPLPSSRLYQSYDSLYLEVESEDYQNGSVLCCAQHVYSDVQIMSSSYGYIYWFSFRFSFCSY